VPSLSKCSSDVRAAGTCNSGRATVISRTPGSLLPSCRKQASASLGIDARSGRSGGVRAVERPVPASSSDCSRPHPAGQRARRLSNASAAAAQHARSLLITNAGVVCLMHTGVAMSLTVSVTDAGGARDCPSAPASLLAYGAEHVPRICSGEPCGARSHADSRCGARPGKGILGHASCRVRASPGAASGSARRFGSPGPATSPWVAGMPGGLPRGADLGGGRRGCARRLGVRLGA
jgi:hypothetical protein